MPQEPIFISPEYCYRAEILRVVDGDTLDVKLDLGFHVAVVQRLRLTRINAPEMKTPQGPLAKTALEGLVKGVMECFVLTKRTDVYGRYLAEVWIRQNPPSARINLSTEQLRTGNAVVYDK